MPAELPVHVSQESLHSIEVPGTFEAEESFDVRLMNHGNSIHMHVHLDDTLSEVASLPATNHYVEGETERFVRVEVDEDRLSDTPVRGKLKVVSAYGAETRWIDVVLTAPDEPDRPVQVDESLAEPAAEPRSESGGGLLTSPVVPVVVLAALALAVAGVAAFVFDDLVVLGGAIAVAVGVAVAMFLLVRG